LFNRQRLVDCRLILRDCFFYRLLCPLNRRVCLDGVCLGCRTVIELLSPNDTLFEQINVTLQIGFAFVRLF